MEKKGRGPQDFWVMLARAQGGERPDQIIVGEYKEIETSEEQEAQSS
jgi:hypothetical protein